MSPAPKNKYSNLQNCFTYLLTYSICSISMTPTKRGEHSHEIDVIPHSSIGLDEDVIAETERDNVERANRVKKF